MKTILIAALVLIVAGGALTLILANNETINETQAAAQQEPAAGDAQSDMSQDASAEQSQADEESQGVYELRIKDHVFTPNELRVPAGEKFKITVYNDDSTPEEFESDDFRREKIIPGNSSATINVGPLTAGEYQFFGEFNIDTAKGTLYAE